MKHVHHFKPSGRTLFHVNGDKLVVLFSKSALKNSGRGIVYIVDPETASRRPSNRHPWIVNVVETDSSSIWVYKMACNRVPRKIVVGNFSSVAGVLI